MNEQEILRLLRNLTFYLDKINRGTESLPQVITQIEQVMEVIDQSDDLKRNIAVRGEMRRCAEEVHTLKSVVDQLDRELFDTEQKISRASI